MNAKQICGHIPVLSNICLLPFAVVLAGYASSQSHPGPVHGLTFNGSIKSIDLKEHRVVVAPLKAGTPVVFVWDDSTKFWKNGVPIKAAVLEPTWPVQIHYHTDSGQPTAYHVWLELTYPFVH